MDAGRLQGGADCRQWSVEVDVTLPPDGRPARGGSHEAEQHAQRGRLPGAVGAEEPGHPTGFGREPQVVYRRVFLYRLVNPETTIRAPACGCSSRHPAQQRWPGKTSTAGTIYAYSPGGDRRPAGRTVSPPVARSLAMS